MNNLDQVGDHVGVRQGGHVAELILLAGQDLSEDSAHDLARSRLRKVVDNDDLLRGGKRPDLLAHGEHQLLLGGGDVVDLLLEGDEGGDGGAGQLVREADDGVFGHERVLD